MNQNRLADCLDHVQQAATDACSFVEGLGKGDFLEDPYTRAHLADPRTSRR